jgi:enoyl-CoA hydratase/carnithine racemase
MLASSGLRTVRDGSVAKIVLDNPPENRITRALIAGLRTAITELEGDRGIGAVVVGGSDVSIFSSGLDLVEWASLSSKETLDALQQGFEAFWALEHMTKPTIAAIEGPCLSAGAELALACDLRITSKSTTLAFPEVDLSWMPSHGGTARLARLVGRSRALEILLSGRTLVGDELLDFGIASAVVSKGNAMTRALEVARTFAAKPRQAVRAIKRTLTEGEEKPYRNRFLLEMQHSAQLVSSDEYKAGISSSRKRVE